MWSSWRRVPVYKETTANWNRKLEIFGRKRLWFRWKFPWTNRSYSPHRRWKHSKEKLFLLRLRSRSDGCLWIERWGTRCRIRRYGTWWWDGAAPRKSNSKYAPRHHSAPSIHRDSSSTTLHFQRFLHKHSPHRGSSRIRQWNYRCDGVNWGNRQVWS